MMGRFSTLELDHGQPPEEPSRKEEPQGSGQESRGGAPRDAAYYLELAVKEYYLSDYEQAMRHFARALNFEPSNKTAWVSQVRCLINLSEFKEAVR
jgi:tetratricopeptide (TPR) repeat protein